MLEQVNLSSALINKIDNQPCNINLADPAASLNLLPKEIIYRLIRYINFKSINYISVINHYYSSLNLTRFNILSRINENFSGIEKIENNWFGDYIQSVTFTQYLEDIFWSIYNQDLQSSVKKSIFSINANFIKRPFDYRNFRNLLFGRKEIEDCYQPEIKYNAKTHIMYRIDMISYSCLKREQNYQILALIY